MANLCELNRHQIYREVKLHSSLQHENIIMLYAAFQQGDQVRACPSCTSCTSCTSYSIACAPCCTPH